MRKLKETSANGNILGMKSEGIHQPGKSENNKREKRKHECMEGRHDGTGTSGNEELQSQKVHPRNRMTLSVKWIGWVDISQMFRRKLKREKRLEKNN